MTAEVEDRVRRACEADEYEEATTATLRAYGPEILGWLVHRLRSETDGADAFAVFAEDLWKGWASFEWRCSLRGWAYTLARNSANRISSSAGRHRRRHVALSDVPEIDRVAREIRTNTLPHLRTTIKDRFRQLREHLSQEDQLILILRVDKKLPWADIAHVLLGDGPPAPDDEAVRRESARLRKRMQFIKGKLRDLGEAAGILDQEG